MDRIKILKEKQDQNNKNVINFDRIKNRDNVALDKLISAEKSDMLVAQETMEDLLGDPNYTIDTQILILNEKIKRHADRIVFLQSLYPVKESE